MPKTDSFLIYNASAGSGKTFTLVKTYLKVLLKAKFPNAFKRILAITFTNKAAGEMKSRILEALTDFSSPKILNEPTALLHQLSDELHMSAHEIHKKSISILDEIMHNYAAFDISTIDGLTHKILRTFAYDLKIPLNFEVELDIDRVLNEAVDRLISKAGTDEKLTKTLVDFAIEKADDDKSWDVSYDFNKTAKLLINENDFRFLASLKDKTLQDFNVLKTIIKQELKETESQIVQKAQDVLKLIAECSLEHTDFSGGSKAYLPKHFEKLANADFNVTFNSKWQENIAEGDLFPKKTPPEIAATITEIQPQLAAIFSDTKALVYFSKFLRTFYKNLTPLSVLNEIQKEVNSLKKEENLVLISEFNSIVSNEIKDQPAPFLYERLGEKFKHFFVDEFQDTSKMQWQNLQPLLANALASEGGSLMLVGDAKQAIYRWRGGLAEQFIDLYNRKENPFHVQPEIVSLDSNFRSFKQVIAFNNDFFEYVATTVFHNEDYASLYQTSNQNIEKTQDGYVNLTFLEMDSEKENQYEDHVYETISNCLNNGFEYHEICVLVRKKKDGVAVSEYLSAKGIPIMSSETLLLDNSPKIRFIINTLKVIMQPENNEAKIEVLNYLAEKNGIINKHGFFTEHLSLSNEDLFKRFEAVGYTVDFNLISQYTLLELTETLIRIFELANTSDAYVHYFMDVVLDFSRKQLSDINSFLDYYENKKNELSIVSPQGFKAVQVMTIHKSKGLEFPVVIFPYADLDVYAEKEPKEWFELNPETYNDFNYTLLDYSSNFENYGDVGQAIFKRHQSELELDNINLLYVALTRAVEQLHIISKKDINSKGEVKESSYAGLFIKFLKNKGDWTDNQLTYSFGNPNRQSQVIESDNSSYIQAQYISVPKEEHNIKIVTNSGYLWDTAQEKAIEKGNIIHHIMALIKTVNDVEFVLQTLIDNAFLSKSQITALKPVISNIVNHPKLSNYYTSNYTIYNERDIVLETGEILRPDRLNINSKNEVIIIDYKSGSEDTKHEKQLHEYARVLHEMNFLVTKKILIYINDNIQIKEF